MLFEEKHSKQNYYTILEYDDINCLTHCQTSIEIVFVTSGNIRVELKDRTLDVYENECIYIMPYEIHRIITPNKSRVIISIFSTDYIADFYDFSKNKYFILPVFPYSETTLYNIKNEHNDPYLLKSALYKLCSDVISNGIEDRIDHTQEDISVKIMLYIHKHYKEPITLVSLSQSLGYSYNYTSYIFHKLFKRGFSSIVNEYRLNESLQLLRTTNFSVTEIAGLCGFSSIRNFNLAFIQQFSMTPSLYKENINHIN